MHVVGFGALCPIHASRAMAKIIVVVVVLGCLLARPASVDGAVSGTSSSVTVSADGTLLLVMRCPREAHDCAEPVLLPDGRIVALRDVFEKSGVYDALTFEPVWQVQWWDHEFNLLWSDDFRHVVRVNQHALRSDWALAFFEDGRLVRAYPSNYLLTRMKTHWFVPYTSNGWRSVWYETLDADLRRGTVNLVTTRRSFYFHYRYYDLGLQEFYTFDLVTGAIINRRVTGAWRPWAYGAVGFAVLVAVQLALRLLWRLHRQWRVATNPRRGFAITPRAGENSTTLL